MGETKSQHVENSDEVEGNLLTLPTVDKVFELYVVYRKSPRAICKRFGICREHFDSAIRRKVDELRMAGLPRSGFGKPIQRAVVSMPARNRGVAA